MEPVIEESSTVTTSTEVNIYKVDEEEKLYFKIWYYNNVLKVG